MTSAKALRIRRMSGKLAIFDRMRLVFEGTLTALRARAGAPPVVVRDVERLLKETRTPRGAMADAARRLCVEVSPRWLHHHCERTWAFGAALGRAVAIDVEPELLFAAAMLHDLGLTERFFRAQECFSISSARAAHELAREHGVSPERAATIADAIVLHLEIHVADREGAVARLLQSGAMLDVLGVGRARLPPALLEAVVAEWPRLEMNRALPLQMRDLARTQPETRVPFYCRRFGFDERIAAVRLTGRGAGDDAHAQS